MAALDPELLILAAHGRALRLIASEAGRHFQGLGQATRYLKMVNPLRSKLLNLEAAYNTIRHITGPSVETFLDELKRALTTACDFRHAPPAHTPPTMQERELPPPPGQDPVVPMSPVSTDSELAFSTWSKPLVFDMAAADSDEEDGKLPTVPPMPTLA
eukprot:CAMPEP_0168487520 /NCGR_PEP_ID=MMETSP0228-20121227/67680_1 /TAXON_ID=133427 /ORGANISM="Protoceratium reticulatum, Strain CCCM 535 (=CCMP 1889)" /LENGTH=157 /DNA_ID=CAMNT_0008504143 /DNA_START=58 /DNA_END=528 /DNA_ORIENTATION=+